MKLTDLKQFKGCAERFPLYLIIAQDPYDREEAIKCFDPLPELLEQPTVEELNSPSLFCKERVLLVRQPNKMIINEILTCSKNPSPAITLIVEMEKLSPTSALYRAINEGGLILDIPTPPPWEQEKKLTAWLTEQGSLTPQLAQLLVSRIGTSKALLMRELEKLSIYADGPITREHIETIGVGFPHETVWELGRAITRRQSKHALATWEELSYLGHTPLSLIPAIRSQMQTGFRICTIGPQAAPRVRGKALTEAQQYGKERYAKALIALYETELLCKSGRESAAMEMLIAKLC